MATDIQFFPRVTIEQVEEGRELAPKFDEHGLLPCVTTAAHNGEGKARAATLDELLRQSDFIVVVLPLTAQTEGMIGPNEFALMKPEAILINGARGPIVQETALLDALDQGRLRAAGLDVFDEIGRAHV